MWSDRSLRMRMKKNTQKIIRNRARPVAAIPEGAAGAGEDMTTAAEEDRTAADGTVVRREEVED